MHRLIYVQNHYTYDKKNNNIKIIEKEKDKHLYVIKSIPLKGKQLNVRNDTKFYNKYNINNSLNYERKKRVEYYSNNKPNHLNSKNNKFILYNTNNSKNERNMSYGKEIYFKNNNKCYINVKNSFNNERNDIKQMQKNSYINYLNKLKKNGNKYYDTCQNNIYGKETQVDNIYRTNMSTSSKKYMNNMNSFGKYTINNIIKNNIYGTNNNINYNIQQFNINCNEKNCFHKLNKSGLIKTYSFNNYKNSYATYKQKQIIIKNKSLIQKKGENNYIYRNRHENTNYSPCYYMKCQQNKSNLSYYKKCCYLKDSIDKLKTIYTNNKKYYYNKNHNNINLNKNKSSIKSTQNYSPLFHRSIHKFELKKNLSNIRNWEYFYGVDNNKKKKKKKKKKFFFCSTFLYDNIKSNMFPNKTDHTNDSKKDMCPKSVSLIVKKENHIIRNQDNDDDNIIPNNNYFINLLVNGEKEAHLLIEKAYKNRDDLMKHMNEKIDDEINEFRIKEHMKYELSYKQMEEEIKNYELFIQNELEYMELQTKQITLNVEDIADYVIRHIIHVNLTIGCNLLKGLVPVQNLLNIKLSSEPKKYINNRKKKKYFNIR
ncbi:conserved Plasmodium protein, unknown function [Plasmodium falciparum 3D7]|uniref:Uncharacterized protein n=3 Tax=Plasmodium falciparum TaxID=5833 RepID=Q8IDG1_PLAF7|nr:conserved Plasmodium protein, unknown function [Plasmodium falciparum 3D7]CAD52661.1 conserved Plasmodium protein, unknown function [Plasmodium falciparum 3D7]|eukprot:XP_001350252.1 conserved Plasmodium protein, unknown function [Plasmodium falciparum 3D7]